MYNIRTYIQSCTCVLIFPCLLLFISSILCHHHTPRRVHFSSAAIVRMYSMFIYLLWSNFSTEFFFHYSSYFWLRIKWCLYILYLFCSVWLRVGRELQRRWAVECRVTNKVYKGEITGRHPQGRPRRRWLNK